MKTNAFARFPAMVSRLGSQPCPGLASAWQASLCALCSVRLTRLGCAGLECAWLGLAGLGARLGWAPISCARLCSVGFGSAGALFVLGWGWARFCRFSMVFVPFSTVRASEMRKTLGFSDFFIFLKISPFLARRRRRQKMVKMGENQCFC